MIIKKKELISEKKEKIRGGRGSADVLNYLKDGDWENIKFISLVKLSPFSSVGEHCHTEDEEFYFICEGSGKAILNGKVFEVESGDAFLCRKDETHGIESYGEGLTFIAVLLKKIE